MTEDTKHKRDVEATIAANVALRAAAEYVVEELKNIRAKGHTSMATDHPILRALESAVAWDGRIPDSNQTKRMVN